MRVDDLASCLRPSFRAARGRMLVWGDWAGIEARVLPWLAGAERTLDIFREGRDIYREVAGGILGKKPGQVSKSERQAYGKVPTLACGFQGGVGAFQNMAVNYGVRVSEDEARRIVKDWRRENDWAPWFWREVENALSMAYDVPGLRAVAGRLAFTMAGTTMFMHLPCGRDLRFPELRREPVTIGDRVREQFTFRAVTGSSCYRKSTYGGDLAQSGTQAVANSVEREALRECDRRGIEVVLHTHDELVVECGAFEVNDVVRELQGIMETVPAWAEGLPLDAECEYGVRYGK